MFFQGNEKYNCATYLRLSRSDGDQQESNSIKNQRALLNDYMGKHPELHKFDEYVDDGYSGTNFERPDFKRMMQDIEKRNVNCIIVKDLSRFGRNYIETGRYLERIFPFMGVRFIAINDHYDSAEENDDKGRILIPFNNLINDTYCRDISLRVRSHLDVKRKEGQFIGSFAGYGYRKDPKDKNHLIIDEYAAGIVQEIFKQKLNGMGNLNNQTWDELWNSPEAEKVRAKVRCCDRDCWMIGSVSPAMHKYIWKPATWVLVHKFKALFTKHPYSMYELKICRDYRDGKVTKEELDKCSTCDMNCVINNGLSEASKEQLKHKTGEEIVDADIAQQMETK